jgi:tRNA1Val (adenine37-N6)-methyltransferase
MNPYFKFKQFTIYQDKCALKVCTDSCILGAWFSQKIASYSRILDMGSGTGLLMLMLAQKTKGNIEGIEINLETYKQGKENITASIWRERLKSHPGDIRSWYSIDKYDFIISNPPFFEEDLKAKSEEKNVAKHSSELSLEDLMAAIKKNLRESGSFGILLPFHREPYFTKLAMDSGFYLTEALRVRQTPAHGFFRSVLHYSGNKAPESSGYEITIHQGNQEYSAEFKELMKDYYLYL